MIYIETRAIILQKKNNIIEAINQINEGTDNVEQTDEALLTYLSECPEENICTEHLLIVIRRILFLRLLTKNAV